MSPCHFSCDVRGSTLSPITLVLRLSNSGLSAASAPSSVVQTGVKSLGWEKSTAQDLPFQSWKEIGPSVVSAVKSGATSPSPTDIPTSFAEQVRLSLGTIQQTCDARTTHR